MKYTTSDLSSIEAAKKTWQYYNDLITDGFKREKDKDFNFLVQGIELRLTMWHDEDVIVLSKFRSDETWDISNLEMLVQRINALVSE